MTGKSLGEHYNKESLLAHLDGELTRQEDAEVSAHLKACWRCRASLADIEERALALAKALETDTFPGPQRIAEAKRRIWEWQAEFEREVCCFPRLHMLRGRALSRLAWGAGMAGCLAAAIWMALPPAPERFVAEPLFKRPAPVLQPRWKPLPELPEIHPPTRVAPLMPLFSSPDPADLWLLEIEAQYGLHRFGACLGMPIKIALDPPGCVVVRGLVNSTEQRDRLEATFAPLSSQSCFRLDVKTVAQASYEQPRAEADREPGKDSVQILGGELPLEEQLEAYFARNPGASSETASASRKVAELADEAVVHADELLAEAWALRRLAERYGEARPDQLPAAATWLLEVMVRDHLQAVRERIGHLRSLVGPPFAVIAEKGGANPFRGIPVSGSDDLAWDAALLRVFHSVQRLRWSVFALFARASLPEDRERAITFSEPPAEAAGALLGSLRESEDKANMAAQSLSTHFRDHPALASQRKPPE